MQAHTNRVEVEFSDSTNREYDLAIGTDAFIPKLEKFYGVAKASLRIF